MSLRIDKLSSDMNTLYENVILKDNILSLETFKESLNKKHIIVEDFIGCISNKEGSISKEILSKSKEISTGFKDLYENFDDKLMIFIVGNGNVGKSTVLNALVGKEVAKTNFLPTTWKIDVYTPELNENEAILKYKDSRQEKLSIEEVINKVNDEEEKSKVGNKEFKLKLKQEARNVKNKEQLDEIKTYLSKKYIYNSDIGEVRWPVKSNWILEKCLLVDTPGLNQELNSLEQLGDANSYYHKADGVIWLLNGTTIASETPNTLLKELDSSLKNVGGLRDNIIGVINRVDLLRNNGGQEAVDKVYNDAHKHFSDKFTRIIGISAKNAYEGIKCDDKEMIKESGILDLQNAIRNIFLSKANKIKSNAKIQGSNRLIKNTKDLLSDYDFKIDKYKEMYLTKEETLKNSKNKLIKNIENDLSILIDTYLDEVKQRVDVYINELANGQGIDFIKNSIYKISEFENRRDSFIENKKLEIENNIVKWEKLSKISEYRYIRPKSKKDELLINITINLSNIDSSSFFTPSTEGTLMSGLGNLIGKIGFAFKKGKIKENLMNTIRNQCNKTKKQILNEFKDIINRNYDSCNNLLNITFKEILFDFKDIESVKQSIKKLEVNIDKNTKEHTLEEILGIRGIDNYINAMKGK